MDSSRFSNTIVSMLDRNSLGPQLAQADTPLHSLRMSYRPSSPLAVARLITIIRGIRPDVLQTWMYHADFLGTMVGKLLHVPTIVWNIRCSFMDMTRYRWMSALARRGVVVLSPFADAIVVNSQAGLSFHKALGYRPRGLVADPELCRSGQIPAKFGGQT